MIEYACFIEKMTVYTLGREKMRSYCCDNTLDNHINGFGLSTEQYYKLQSLSNSKNF